jgi:hypothetical protein
LFLKNLRTEIAMLNRSRLFYDFDLTYSDLQIAARDTNTKIGAVAAIGESALRQSKLSGLPVAESEDRFLPATYRRKAWSK